MTSSTDPILLGGAPGSPYTRKMLAVLRYRQLPYRYMILNRDATDMPKPPVSLLPTFWFPDGEGGALRAVTDSTPIIRRLEREHAGRSVLPPDPALALLDELLEDYGDEWLTKAMFHYRWHYRDDIERAGDVLPRWRAITASEETVARLKQQFSERQISRLRYVGSSPETAAVIEDSYRRFLDALDAHLRVHPFLMGARPGASDFGVFGQLTQLTHFDPTPMALTLARSPRVFAWVDLLEDLSGLPVAEDGWLPRADMAHALRDLLAEVGRTYVPVMLANARALAQGAERVETEVEGRPWVQQPFAYQGKCVRWLRESWHRLGEADRAALAPLLADTGCLALFEG
jgi:glutathione S-transferase